MQEKCFPLNLFSCSKSFHTLFSRKLTIISFLQVLVLNNRIVEKLVFQLFAENLLAAGLFFSWQTWRTEPTLYYMHMVAFFFSNARKANIQMKFETAEGKNCETCEKMPAYDIELNTHSRRQTQQPLPLTGNESLRACEQAFYMAAVFV